MGACVLCEQQITNPLSPERLIEQMETWLTEKRPDLIRGLKAKADELLDENINNDQEICIVTGKKMKVCVYCFTEHIFKWLLSQKPGLALMKQYMTYFNFDESRHGYWQTAYELGMTP